MNSLLSVHDDIAIIPQCFVGKDPHTSRLSSLLELSFNWCYSCVQSAEVWSDKSDLYKWHVRYAFG